MSKRGKPVKRAKPRKTGRNPFARALASGLYRKRVVKGAGVYRRRPKHLRKDGESD